MNSVVTVNNVTVEVIFSKQNCLRETLLVKLSHTFFRQTCSCHSWTSNKGESAW